MGALGSKLRTAEGGRLLFKCPGCNDSHQIQVGDGPGPRWGFNGDGDRPTFTPSVLVWWDEPANLNDIEALNRDIADARARREAGEERPRVPMVSKQCHSFVTDGRIQFLGDCTHSLANQTVDLPDWPKEGANVAG